jgi:predicted O-methyltransferase YrrM
MSSTNDLQTLDIDYFGMMNWVHDLPKNMKSRCIFVEILSLIKKDVDCDILEIGTYVGGSLLNILNFLPRAKGTAIDCWKLSEKEQEVIKNTDKSASIKNAETVFYKNINKTRMNERIQIIKDDSTSALLSLLRDNKAYDFIYVDGSHYSFDVYADLVLSFSLLKHYGILGIDDYTWMCDSKDQFAIPKRAVDHFLEKYKDDYIIISKSYRVFIQKK